MWSKPGCLIYLLYVIKSPQSSMILHADHVLRAVINARLPVPFRPDMGLLDFIKTADPRKVQAVEVQKKDDQVKLLESTSHCFMSLVTPAAGGSSFATAPEVSAPAEVEPENVVPEDTYLDLTGPDLSLSRTQSGNFANGNSVAKTLVGLRQLMPTSPLVSRPSFQADIQAHVVQSARITDVSVYTAAATVTSAWENVGVTLTSKCTTGNDLEILILKSLLAEEAEKAERAETAEVSAFVSVSALTGEVSVLKSTIAQKDTHISLLDSRATYLKSALDDSKAACDFKEKAEAQQEEQAHVLYNRVAELEAHVMDVSGRLEGEFYPTYLTTLAGRRWFLTYGIQLAVLKCFKSPEYQGILGHALGRAVDFGMQEGLEAGYENGVAGTPLSAVEAYNPEDARTSYFDAVRALEDVDFLLVNLLKSKKDAGMDEVLDCFILDGPLADFPEAAHLQPCLEQLFVPIHHSDDKAIVGETSLSFALLNVHSRAEGTKKHVAALRQLMMEIVSNPLSSQTWVGETSTSAAPLSVEDFDEVDTDEALGSVVSIPKFEACRFLVVP
ncbi:hypothetical protein Tco_0526279 [Tanacetum coccineum]